MSKVTTPLNNGQQEITNYDLGKIFIGNNRYETETVVNSEYNPQTILAGTIMGRIAGTNAVFPWTASAADGSQFPIGIIAADILIQDGVSASVPICVSGDVAKEKIVFWNAPTDTFTSVVNQRTLFDRLQSDSVGIKIVPTNEQTYLDNQ